MMNRLVLFSLAATAGVPAAAFAQDARMEAVGATLAPEVEAEMQAERYRDYRRLERGGLVPDQWRGPSYQIIDWGAYGLYQPMHGHRWIRYYDDALLIDSQGRVWDGRYGMDWSRFDGWDYDKRGIPVYVGGHGAVVEHHAYAKHHGGGYGHHQGGYGHPGYGYAYPAAGYGYGGYGYAGYGYGGAWVTETTVTYSDCCCAQEAVVYEAPPPVYTPPPPPPPPPPPLPGERG